MNYEKEYKKLKADIENAYLFAQTDSTKAVLEHILPELAESDDEKIRKALIDYFDEANKVDENPLELYGIHTDKVLAWLEKQGEQKSKKEVDNLHNYLYGEQKPADKIEPKFNVGDYLVNDYCKGKVIALTDDAYLLDTEQGIPFSYEHNAHLWTIQDAEDGDVLAVEDKNFATPFVAIYKSLGDTVDEEPTYNSRCFIGFDGNFYTGEEGHVIEGIHPATKEQRVLLFSKMKEAGYEWDAEKKEPKKIHVIDEGKAEMDYCFTKMMNGEKINPTWSDVDEADLNNIIWLCNNCINGSETTWIPSQAIRIKSLIERIKDTVFLQPKQKWTEEDEKMVKDIIAAIDTLYYHGMVNWLKSLKERVQCSQTKWKPSEEHIRYLQAVVNDVHNIGSESCSIALRDLLGQLKKL